MFVSLTFWMADFSRSFAGDDGVLERVVVAAVVAVAVVAVVVAPVTPSVFELPLFRPGLVPNALAMNPGLIFDVSLPPIAPAIDGTLFSNCMAAFNEPSSLLSSANLAISRSWRHRLTPFALFNCTELYRLCLRTDASRALLFVVMPPCVFFAGLKEFIFNSFSKCF